MIEVDVNKIEQKMQQDRSLFLKWEMEQQATKVVNELVPSFQLTISSHYLAIRLHLFLNIKDADYYVIQSLMMHCH